MIEKQSSIQIEMNLLTIHFFTCHCELIKSERHQLNVIISISLVSN